jgi:dUTP pyrophosphatase
MRYVRPLGRVPDVIEGSSGSGADRSCEEPVAADTSNSNATRYADRMRLKIARLDSTVPLPGYGTSEAAGFDLAASHDVVVQPGQIALVRTGLIIEVPAGHFLGIFARSSTPLKRGLLVANGVGVIDPDYSGPTDEVMVQVLNFTQAEVRVQRGDRLAQGIVLPAPRVTWDEVEAIRPATRGGFGATGA